MENLPLVRETAPPALFPSCPPATPLAGQMVSDPPGPPQGNSISGLGSVRTCVPDGGLLQLGPVTPPLRASTC